MTKTTSKLLLVVCFCASAGALAGVGGPVPFGFPMTFSVDFQGPTAMGATPEGFGSGIPIGEGEILTPTVPGPFGPNPPSLGGPLPPPGIVVDAGAAPTVATTANPLYGGAGRALGIGASFFGTFEVDALSYGRDEQFFQPHGSIVFSVDEFATGLAGPTPPDVATEGAGGFTEAATDVFRYNGGTLPVAPPPIGPPPGGGPGNTDYIDGNAVAPVGGFVGPGTGLVEPVTPALFTAADDGDNLDALDIGTTPTDLLGSIYISLDGSFADPLDFVFGINSGTAAANGVSAADILVSIGGALGVYAPAGALGLDLLGADDVDALILIEDGVAGFSPATDIILFSVRRGSAVIGAPDSVFGVGIEEGDILTVPFTGPFAMSANPAIFIAAEALGLLTARSGLPLPFSPYGDDLDALSVVIPIPASLPLMASAAAGLVFLRRRRMA